jgi:hypothetical protein
MSQRFREWLNSRSQPPSTVGTPGAITNYLDILNGEGEHAWHVREQVGDRVLCSCGEFAIGRME